MRKFKTDWNVLHTDVINRDVCRCGHIISSHENKISICEVCCCNEYIPKDNLKYLELMSDKRS